MIHAYVIQGDHLAVTLPRPGDALPENTVWIDLLNPNAEEDRAVEGWMNAPVPTRDDMREIEESSRFYSADGAQYLTAPVLHAADTEYPGVSPVTFILTASKLVTVRYAEPKSFGLYITRALKPGNALVGEHCDGLTIFLGLLEAVTDRLADILENVALSIDHSSAEVFRRSPDTRPMGTTDFRESLTRIGRQGEFLSKVRESLTGVSRLLVYLTTSLRQNEGRKDARNWLRSIERDAESLATYVDYLSNRITFLLDTLVGLISIEQNAIIKIFSVAAVGFMPPTLVASIYGMNFHSMPELSWPWGYPMALGFMVLSAVLPLFYFRRKGWL
jgi:magnesium transporter